MNTNLFEPLAKITAFLSFIVGTILLLAYLISKSEYLVMIGFVYLNIAILINLFILLIILLRVIFVKNDRMIILISTLLMLINIPIAYIYTLIVTQV